MADYAFGSNPPYRLRTRLDFLDRCSGRRREQEEPARVEREGTKAELPIERHRALVLGIDDNGEHRQGSTGSENAPDCVRQQQFADALTPYPLDSRQATDQGGGNGIIA